MDVAYESHSPVPDTLSSLRPSAQEFVPLFSMIAQPPSVPPPLKSRKSSLATIPEQETTTDTPTITPSKPSTVHSTPPSLTSSDKIALTTPPAMEATTDPSLLLSGMLSSLSLSNLSLMQSVGKQPLLGQLPLFPDPTLLFPPLLSPTSPTDPQNKAWPHDTSQCKEKDTEPSAIPMPFPGLMPPLPLMNPLLGGMVPPIAHLPANSNPTPVETEKSSPKTKESSKKTTKKHRKKKGKKKEIPPKQGKDTNLDPFAVPFVPRTQSTQSHASHGAPALPSEPLLPLPLPLPQLPFNMAMLPPMTLPHFEHSHLPSHAHAVDGSEDCPCCNGTCLECAQMAECPDCQAEQQTHHYSKRNHRRRKNRKYKNNDRYQHEEAFIREDSPSTLSSLSTSSNSTCPSTFPERMARHKKAQNRTKKNKPPSMKNEKANIPKLILANLNKLSPENFGRLLSQCARMPVYYPETLRVAGQRAHSKIIENTGFIGLYVMFLVKLSSHWPTFTFRDPQTNCGTGEIAEESQEDKVMHAKAMEFLQDVDIATKTLEDGSVVTERLVNLVNIIVKCCWDYIANNPTPDPNSRAKWVGKICGNYVLLCELYHHKCIPFSRIHKAMQDLIANKADWTWATLYQVMSFHGNTLEKDNKEAMDEYFAAIENFLETQEENSRLRFLMLDLIDNRSNGWKNCGITRNRLYPQPSDTKPRRDNFGSPGRFHRRSDRRSNELNNFGEGHVPPRFLKSGQNGNVELPKNNISLEQFCKQGNPPARPKCVSYASKVRQSQHNRTATKLTVRSDQSQWAAKRGPLYLFDRRIPPPPTRTPPPPPGSTP